jgi:hypothetical protein
MPGSGDSTVPSPLPKAHHKPNNPNLVLTDPFFTSESHLHPDEPPSPNTLARRLNDISPRRSNNGTPMVTDDEGDEEDSYFSNGKPVLLLDGNTLVSAPAIKYVNGISSPHHTPRPPTSLPTSLPSQVPDFRPDTLSHLNPKDVDVDAEDILKESIRGVWRLWKNSKHRNEETDKDVFLKVVKEVVGEATA